MYTSLKIFSINFVYILYFEVTIHTVIKYCNVLIYIYRGIIENIMHTEQSLTGSW